MRIDQYEVDNGPPCVCFITGSAGDWGGASRVVYTMLRGLDRTPFRPYVQLPGKGSIEPELERHGLPYEVWGRLAEPGSASA